MRLIDADALKKILNFVYDCDYIGSKSKEGIVSDIIEEIDNAPTVKFSLMPADETKEDAYMRGYEKGKIAGILMANQRPQGEWLKSGKSKTTFFCSECGREIDTKPFTRPDNFPFCHCGADMRGKEE